MTARLIAMSAGLALAFLGSPVLAQQVDPETIIVEALVVQARTAGPPWWKAEKDGKTVYVFGLPTTLPRNFKWDQTALKRRMRLADVAIMNARIEDRAEEDPAPRGSLEPSLPESLRARFVAARERQGLSPGKFSKLSPLKAAFVLSQDLLDKAELDLTGGYREYRLEAESSRAKVVDLDDFRRPDGRFPDAQGQACLEAAVAAVEGQASYKAAAEAWAKGDIRGALDVPRGERVWRCVVPPMDIIVGYVNAIDTAVKNPRYRTVIAGIPLHTMVAKDGVVERLRALGYTVTDPASIED